MRGLRLLPKTTRLIVVIFLSIVFAPISLSAPSLSHPIQALPGSFQQRENDQYWSQTFDDNQSRHAYSLIESHLGGFIVTGYSVQSRAGIGDEHVWIARLDPDGDIEWERWYVDGHRGWGQAVIECQNNDFVIAGVIDDEFSNILVLRTDSQGNQLWEQILNFTQHQEAYALTELPSGRLIVCGWAWHYRPTNPIEGFILCLENDGSLLWYREYGGLEDDWFYSTTWIPEGGLAFTGFTECSRRGMEGMWVVKTDLQGNVEWNQTFGGPVFDRGYSIVCNAQNELTIAGVTQDVDNNRFDAFIVQAASNGSQLWNQTIGLELDEVAKAITVCSDGGYAITGEISQSDEDPWKDMLVVRLDNEGTVLWQKIYGGQGNDFGESLVESMSGDLVLAGSTSSYGFVGGTAWLVLVPDAPPPPIDPRQVNLPIVFVGLGLALIVLGTILAVFVTSRREYKRRIQDCN